MSQHDRAARFRPRAIATTRARISWALGAPDGPVPSPKTNALFAARTVTA